jgi:TolB-like protein
LRRDEKRVRIMETSLLMAVLISMEGVAKVAVLPFGNISGDTSDN